MSSQQSLLESTCHRMVLHFSVTLVLLGGVIGRAAGDVRANAGFPIASPESQGVSSKRLDEMTVFVQSHDYDVRSLLIVRHGRLILEWYGPGITREHNHNVFSVTKSVVGLLAGIAIAHEKIDGIHSDLQTLLPGRQALMDANMRSITLERLLTMRSGLPVSRANRPTGAPRDRFNRIHQASDRTRLILRELVPSSRPDARFAYSNIDPHLVAEAISAATGMSLPDYADQTLFGPLEFANTEWRFPDKTNQVPGGYGLHLRAIDIAKIGQLMLTRGHWRGKSIIQKDWIDRSIRDQTGTGYGFYWWVDNKNNVIAAKGVRGQRVFVVPDERMVMVVTANLMSGQVATVTHQLLEDYLLPSVTPTSRARAKP
ncbi:MAG: serine hydrolase [Planctomycetota bacterium]